MSTTVRLFTFAGTVSAANAGGSRLTYDSVQMLKWPSLGRDKLTVDTVTTAETQTTAAPTGTEIALIQVSAGKTIAYEVMAGPDKTSVLPSATSPTLSGEAMIQFGPGWRFAALEVDATA